MMLAFYVRMFMATMRQFLTTVLIAVFIPHGALFASELQLQPETLAAWQNYVLKVGHHSDTGLDRELLSDVCTRHKEVLSGHIVVVPAKDNGIIRVPRGLIHDLIGFAFIPDSNLAEVLSVLGDYDHYNAFYAPTVVRSRGVSADESTQIFSMTWFRKVVTITASIQADFTAQTALFDSKRGRILTQSGQIREIRHFGEPDEKKLPPDVGRGYVWRLFSILDLEETDGGVALRLEALALSRDIPGGTRWLVEPIVNRVSHNALAETLLQTTRAVQSHRTYLGKATFGAADMTR